MPKFRKKPVIVEAEVYRAGLEDGFTPCKITAFGPSEEQTPFVRTRLGKEAVSPGDWIITESDGWKAVFKPCIFEAIYEPVEGEEETDVKS